STLPHFGDDGEKFAVGGNDTVKVYHSKTGMLDAWISVGTDQNVENYPEIRNAWISPDGNIAVCSLSDGRCLAWDLRNRNLLNDVQVSDQAVIDVSFSADSKKFITASGDNTARAWWIGPDANGRPYTDKKGLAMEFKGHLSQVLSARFSTDGKRVVTG